MSRHLIRAVVIGLGFAVPASAQEQVCDPAYVPFASVQLANLIVEAGEPGFCYVTGQVVRAFRGPYTVGQWLKQDFYCDIPEDHWGFGASYYAAADLAASPIVELHFDADGRIAVSHDFTGMATGSGYVLLDAPTDAPVWAPPPACIPVIGN